MPCCAPRYGTLIVAVVDFVAGMTGFIILSFGQESALILICLTFPSIVLTLLGTILTASFIKKNVLLATFAFALNLSLILGCGVIILVLLLHKFRSYSYTPVIIAALVYTIIIQIHFSCVIHDFRTQRLPTHNRRFQYLDQTDCDT